VTKGHSFTTENPGTAQLVEVREEGGGRMEEGGGRREEGGGTWA